METTTKVRIDLDQLASDNELVERLQASLKGWKKELELMEKELLEQAAIDIKYGTRSARYLALEKRDKDLRDYIHEAQRKLGLVHDRYASLPIGKLIQDTINKLKP